MVIKDDYGLYPFCLFSLCSFLIECGLIFFLSWSNLDFLSSEVMHGEGNLLAHLVIVGYKVSYQQVSSSNCAHYSYFHLCIYLCFCLLLVISFLIPDYTVVTPIREMSNYNSYQNVCFNLIDK